MKVIAVICLLLAGCVTGGKAVGPNGRPVFHIEAVSTAGAYAKASERCPGGYDVLNSRQQGLFAVLTVECR